MLEIRHYLKKSFILVHLLPLRYLENVGLFEALAFGK